MTNKRWFPAPFDVGRAHLLEQGVDPDYVQEGHDCFYELADLCDLAEREPEPPRKCRRCGKNRGE